MNPKERGIIPAAEVLYENQSHLSPIDGREAFFTIDLRPYFSEEALHRYRANVEIDALIALSESGFPEIPTTTTEQKAALRSLLEPGTFDPRAVMEYDHLGRNGIGPLEHDVKAGEIYLGELMDQSGLSQFKDSLHFAVTSEDISNIALNEMLRDGINNVWLPQVLSIMDSLAELSEKYASTPVAGRTHEAVASPTTFGKRFSYFLGNMIDIMEQIEEMRLAAKFSGAVGNYNATTAVAPDFDYRSFARQFIERRGMHFIENANQRNPHIAIADLLGRIKIFNVIGQDLAHHVENSLMMGLLELTDDPGHVGSSVMPHKINPWRTEVGDGYFEQSNRLIDGAAEGLVASTLERDASDHPWERAYGEMIGKSLVGTFYVLKDLQSIRVNENAAVHELESSYKVLAEAVQTAGRMEEFQDIYMMIKELIRGKELDQKGFRTIVDIYVQNPEVKARLLEMTPSAYIGKAPEIARDTVGRYQEFRRRIEHGILDEAKSVDAVLFDFDGTLHFGDKDELIARLRYISEKMNLGFTSDEINEFGNRTDWREMKQLMVVVFNQRHPAGTITEEEFQTTNDTISGAFDDRFVLGKGAKETLEALKASGKKIGVVTTRGRKSLERLLELYGIKDTFDVVVNRDDTQEKKPHPAPIVIALNKMGIPENSRDRVLYVGDLQVDDVIAGNAAGVKTALITTAELNPYGAKPTYKFDCLEEIKQRFGR
ncbi:MAG: HAD-IA family hydrolase [bacterium]|nr:HAD-IA family hydrolase [bacterium]